MRFGTKGNNMKVLVDTNVLFSAIVFPRSKPAMALEKAIMECKIVLCEQNIHELDDVIQRKCPNKIANVQKWLNRTEYELLPLVNNTCKEIRDATDQPILNAAIAYGVDIILTGDKDFLSMSLEKPVCMAPTQFLAIDTLDSKSEKDYQ